MSFAFVWDPDFSAYRFGPDHPFNPKRLELAVSLMEELGLLDGPGVTQVSPRTATDAELHRVHDPAYVEAVRRLGALGEDDGEGWRWGLGTEDNPVFAGMHEAAARVVGGTLTAAELVMSGRARRAFNIAGGLHHAHRDRASGFCIYNDLAAAIAWMREAHGARVLYIDYDAHHGDGVQGIFYDDPEVCTLSIHESGKYLFPGTGHVGELGEGAGYGYSLNLPMEAFTEDEAWLESYAEILPQVAESFRPDVVVLQNGCDAHVLDPLTHLRGTTRLYHETVRLTCEVADRLCGGRVVATGGGGYAVWTVVPRAWSLVWAGLTGARPADRLPQGWLDRWQGESPELLPPLLHDPPGLYPPAPHRAEVEARNRRTTGELKRLALPLLRGWDRGF